MQSHEVVHGGWLWAVVFLAGLLPAAAPAPTGVAPASTGQDATVVAATERTGGWDGEY